MHTAPTLLSALFQTPGPGTYNTTEPCLYKDKSPHYSMTSRNVMPGDTTQKPGPGAHSPENVSTHTQDPRPYTGAYSYSPAGIVVKLPILSYYSYRIFFYFFFSNVSSTFRTPPTQYTSVESVFMSLCPFTCKFCYFTNMFLPS